MHYLVTGSSGFVGTHFCHRLIATGHVVTAFDIHEDNSVKQGEGYGFVQGDLTTGEGLDDIPWDKQAASICW